MTKAAARARSGRTSRAPARRFNQPLVGGGGGGGLGGRQTDGLPPLQSAELHT